MARKSYDDEFKRNAVSYDNAAMGVSSARSRPNSTSRWLRATPPVLLFSTTSKCFTIGSVVTRRWDT